MNKALRGGICGFCAALAVIGFELATGIEMSFGERMLIVIPASVILGVLVGGQDG